MAKSLPVSLSIVAKNQQLLFRPSPPCFAGCFFLHKRKSTEGPALLCPPHLSSPAWRLPLYVILPYIHEFSFCSSSRLQAASQTPGDEVLRVHEQRSALDARFKQPILSLLSNKTPFFTKKNAPSVPGIFALMRCKDLRPKSISRLWNYGFG